MLSLAVYPTRKSRRTGPLGTALYSTSFASAVRGGSSVNPRYPTSPAMSTVFGPRDGSELAASTSAAFAAAAFAAESEALVGACPAAMDVTALANAAANTTTGIPVLTRTVTLRSGASV